MPAKTKTSKPTPRKALHAYLSDEAHTTWHDVAAAKGVSVSALIEALAPTLEKVATNAVVDKARVVDTARRRRSR